MFPIKLLWGMLFCQGFLGSIFVVGWSYRLTQRAVLKYWWSRSTTPLKGDSFVSFASAGERTRGHGHWPNWFCGQQFRERLSRQPETSIARHAWTVVKSSFESLWVNVVIGLRAIFNTWVLTLPACLLWWFGWYDGWNNSFNKGYEQAAVGPLVSIVGIFLFIAVMFYVPLAQARQAATGEWRSFYDFRLIWKIARSRWLGCMLLAALYFLLALPLNILKATPMFSPQNNARLAGLTDPEVIKHLNSFFFWAALIALPAYVVLRVLAGRLYASGLLSLLRRGQVETGKLSELEGEVLKRLNLDEPASPRERHFFVRFVAWTTTRVGRIVSTVGLALIWFGFVAQIYVAEFFKHHLGARGWLNQPLVQLPWFHYLPARLKNPAEEVFGAAFLLLLGWLVWRITRLVMRARRSSTVQ